MDNILEARTYYNVLRQLYTRSNKSRRDYVHGCKYVNMFGLKYVNVVSIQSHGNTDIKVKLQDGTDTTIRIRMAPDVLTENLLLLHDRLKDEESNSRNKCGDSGKMFGLGYYNDDKEFFLSKDNHDIKTLMITISQIRNEWVKETFPDEYNTYFSEKLERKEFVNCLSDFMVQSRSLANSSHYDTNDGTITICTWFEETVGNTENWYMVFPNVTAGDDRDTAIQLSQGCTVSWDAARLRHASSRVSYRVRQNGSSGGNCEVQKRNRNTSNT